MNEQEKKISSLEEEVKWLRELVKMQNDIINGLKNQPIYVPYPYPQPLPMQPCPYPNYPIITYYTSGDIK